MQARHLADHRARLVANGVQRSERLEGSGRDSADRALFTVRHAGRTLAPDFQFTADGSPRSELRPLVVTLTAGGVDGWQLWTWLISESSYLSGEVPHEVVRTQPGRALRAAERFAAANGT